MKLLFLIKQSYTYGETTTGAAKSGLLNSATITSNELRLYYGIKTKVSTCIDENSIDKEVALFKPDVCILEAVWVTPAKMKELSLLHPDVNFIIRIHSEIPFIAVEGNLLGWVNNYSDLNVTVSFNSEDTTKDILSSTGIKAIYLPNIYSKVKANYYDPGEAVKFGNDVKKHVDIACFGAIRPMKNQLIQAVAAINMARKHGRKMSFHMNTERTEQGGENVLKNIRDLFKKTPFELVEHKWLDRKDFLKEISTMDAGMQVSFSESFNLVTADFVYSGVPIVVSEAIKWMPKELQASTIYSDDISNKLWQALILSDYYKSISQRNLARYNASALEAWGEVMYSVR